MPSPVESRAFEHDALFYDDLDSFVGHVGDFVRAGLESGEAVLVATDAAKGEALRDHLGSFADVDFVDMASVGLNPGRIIPVWREFLSEAIAAGRGARGVGEPVWPGRSQAELVECQHHESLLNLAFGDGPGWTLLCPYDVTHLPEDVLQEAMRSHPHVVVGEERRPSSGYADPARVPDQLASPLAEPDVPVTTVAFAGDGFTELRDEALRRARNARVPRERLDDFALAVHELATNSVRHGRGAGVARFWTEPGAFVTEIADAGQVDDPLVGRAKPPLGDEGGRGLWMVHQMCDLVQLRTSPRGTVVRISMNVA